MDFGFVFIGLGTVYMGVFLHSMISTLPSVRGWECVDSNLLRQPHVLKIMGGGFAAHKTCLILTYWAYCCFGRTSYIGPLGESDLRRIEP
jgi:hypothetical protein